ncbi:hypothetical protein EV676_105307, partial [Caldimonas thermodepolymerans]
QADKRPAHMPTGLNNQGSIVSVVFHTK